MTDWLSALCLGDRERPKGTGGKGAEDERSVSWAFMPPTLSLS